MADDSSEIVKEMAESVAATNLKVLADGPAFFQNQAYSIANNSMQGWTSMNQAIVGKITESIIHTDPREGSADLAAAAVLAKIAQTVPPLTSGQSVPNQG